MLDAEGRLYYDWIPTDEEPLPLTSGYASESPKNTEASVIEALDEWSDVVQIAANGSVKLFSEVKVKSLCYSLGKSSRNNFVQSQLIGGSENECFTYFMRIRNECN